MQCNLIHAHSQRTGAIWIFVWRCVCVTAAHSLALLFYTWDRHKTEMYGSSDMERRCANVNSAECAMCLCIMRTVVHMCMLSFCCDWFFFSSVFACVRYRSHCILIRRNLINGSHLIVFFCCTLFPRILIRFFFFFFFCCVSFPSSTVSSRP